MAKYTPAGSKSVPAAVHLQESASSYPARSNPRYLEITTLHKFFVKWFKGKIPLLPKTFEPFTNALASEFVLISPDGKRTGREHLIKTLYELHACRSSDQDSHYNIWIEHFKETYLGAKLWLIEYEEHQCVDGGKHTIRLSTALLRERDTDTDLEWIRVHETWTTEDSTSTDDE